MSGPLLEAIAQEQWYEVVRLVESGGWSGELSDEAISVLIALGRFPTIADHCIADRNLLNRPANAIAFRLEALQQTGRSAEVVPALNNQDQLLQAPGLAMQIALCLQQAGATKNAAGILLNLARSVAFNPSLVRQAIRAVRLSTENEDFHALEAVLSPMLPTIPNEAWLKYELLRHGVPDQNVSAFPLPDSHTINTAKQGFNSIVTGVERLHSGPSVRLERTLDQSALNAPLRRLYSDLVEVVREPWFKKRLDFLNAIRSEFAPEAGDPIQVISTGRVGTTALFELLERSDAYAPYHSYSWLMLPKHRWHALNLLYSEAPLSSAGRDLFRDYLSCRFPEIVRAYRLNRVPVLINHWDVIFAPFLKALFPRISYLFMRRDEQKVIHSLIRKRQFAYVQLIDLKLETAPDSQDGVLRLPSIEETPRDVAWYMAFTERFWESLVALNGGERVSAILSDNLFAGQPTAIEGLREAFPDIGRTDAEIADHFSVPINEKTDRLFGLTERQSSWIDDARDHLANFLSD
ncbi:MAG: hypothetical protein QNJ84_09870 [Alphaproteobacteria bacterium]|nr:hypothetical protein [Alphaproteobacteria bacterium]